MSLTQIDKDDLDGLRAAAAALVEAFDDDPFFRFLFDADPAAPWSVLPLDIKVGYRILFEEWLQRNTHHNASVCVVGKPCQAVMLFADLAAPSEMRTGAPLALMDASLAGQLRLPKPCVRRLNEVFLPLSGPHESLMYAREGWLLEQQGAGEPGGRSHANTLKINLLGVRRLSRGQGLARVLLDHAVQTARQRGRAGVYLNTMNEVNVGFYQHLGFHIASHYRMEDYDEELEQGDVRYPDARVTNWLMALPIVKKSSEQARASA